MQIVELRGKKWMVGLEWEILPGDASVKEESKKAATTTGQTHGLIIEYDAQHSIGLTKAISKEKSAALYLALANQTFRDQASSNDDKDWIVVEEVGDDKYWMSVISNGIPSPGYDTVFDRTTIKNKIEDLLINDTYTFFSPCGEIISLFEGIKAVKSKGINELTEDVETKIKFVKLVGIPNSVIYAGIGIVVVGALLMGVSSFFEGRSLQEKMENIKKEEERKQQLAEMQYNQSLKDYNLAVEKAKKDAYESVVLDMAGTAQKILNGWVENIGAMTLGTHGWDLTEAECYIDPSREKTISMCDYKFEKTGLATTRMLMEDYPNIKVVGNTAVLSLPVNISKESLTIPSVDVVKELPVSSKFNTSLISQLQLLKTVEINSEIKDTTPITYNLPQKPVKPGTLPNKDDQNTGIADLGIGRGEIIIKGKDLDYLDSVANNVDFDKVGLKKVKVKFSGLMKLDWELVFNYFIQTKDGMIAGSSSAGLSSDSVKSPKSEQKQQN